jgi:hypothetical protein
MQRAFDLNSQETVTHWGVREALRELIANALDETEITQSDEVIITDLGNRKWSVRDFGRGLAEHHLTQNESKEKHVHPNVIGFYGMGLKDALSLLYREGVTVEVHSPNLDFTLGLQPKTGSEIVTLHALISEPTDPAMVGTEVLLTGIDKEAFDEAKAMFLRFREDTVIETTKFGDVLEAGSSPGIYIQGLRVAEEESFLFSYNITDLTEALRKGMNRERNNVGRSAYTDRVQDILMKCGSDPVADRLTSKLVQVSQTSGAKQGELGWAPIVVHACKVLATNRKIAFITSRENSSAAYMREQYASYEFVVVPDETISRLKGQKDYNGNKLVTFAGLLEKFNESFEVTPIPLHELTNEERSIFALHKQAIAVAALGNGPTRIDSVVVSEMLTLEDDGTSALGVWEPDHHRISIKRSQLTNASTFLGVFLHEYAHAATGTDDMTSEFEDALTELLGTVASQFITANTEAA